METLSDAKAIAKIKEGELDYFAHIVNKYTVKFLNYVKQKASNGDDAQDIVQNSFIKFYKSLENFDETKPFSPYFYSIINNEIAQFYRDNPSMAKLDEHVETISAEFEPTSDITQVLAGLKDEHKTALKLYAQGFSYKEISVQLKKPLNTIRTYIRRGRLQLQHEKT